jgi:hypothetical protein
MNDSTAFYKTNCFYEHPKINHVASWQDAIKLLTQWLLTDV